jgi:hypothetical protein
MPVTKRKKILTKEQLQDYLSKNEFKGGIPEAYSVLEYNKQRKNYKRDPKRVGFLGKEKRTRRKQQAFLIGAASGIGLGIYNLHKRFR